MTLQVSVVIQEVLALTENLLHCRDLYFEALKGTVKKVKANFNLTDYTVINP